VAEEVTSKAASRAWFLGALSIFGIALATSFHGFWGADLRSEVPFESDRAAGRVTTADYQMAIWATSRNARALVSAPLDIFDAEPCYPSPNSLTVYHPLITLGILAIPAQLATGEPIAAFNFALFLNILIAAIAMYLLVADWSGMPAAGIVAGLLYAFADVQIARTFHVHHADNAWLLFAFFFAHRLFERGRWRDALGLGASVALQAGSSFYPLIASAAIGVPLGAWFLWHYRGGVKRVAPVLGAAAIALAGGLFVGLPYVAGEAAGNGAPVLHHYAIWSSFLPGGMRFPGWTALLLALCALVLGRDRALAGIRGDPRAALAIAAVFTALVACGGNHRAVMEGIWGGTVPLFDLPNPYAALESVVPALGALRVTSDLALGVQQVLCILAGLGAAAVLCAVPRGAFPPVAAAMVALAFVETIQPTFLGMADEEPFRGLALRPSEETISFFERLEERGNTGPLLEVPIRVDRGEKDSGSTWKEDLTRDQFATAYHHRRTSSCIGARFQTKARESQRWSRRLLQPGGVEEARASGFTTVVVHHPDDRSERATYANRLRAVARESSGRLQLLASSSSMTAYELSAAPRDPGSEFDPPSDEAGAEAAGPDTVHDS